MAKKDWDYYKAQYIDDATKMAHERIRLLERYIESPIERIAFIYITAAINSLCYIPHEIVVHRQTKIDRYTVDILVEDYRTGLKIVVECDGHDFHEKTKEQAAHDKERDRFFTMNGYTVLRYTGSQVCNAPDEIEREVGILLDQRRKL